MYLLIHHTNGELSAVSYASPFTAIHNLWGRLVDIYDPLYEPEDDHDLDVYRTLCDHRDHVCDLLVSLTPGQKRTYKAPNDLITFSYGCDEQGHYWCHVDSQLVDDDQYQLTWVDPPERS